MDALKILKRLSTPDENGIRVTFYVNKGVHDAFKRACGGVPASKVINELMKQFIESSQSKK